MSSAVSSASYTANANRIEQNDLRSRARRGGIGMLGSARATNEENYYAQKFARRR